MLPLVMNSKSLLGITVFCWSIIGFFYLLYHLQIEPVIVGVLREMTLLPSFLVGILCPLLCLFSFLKK